MADFVTPQDYASLVYRHLDRMSDSLKKGIEVGEIKNATLLMSYYLFILHLHSMLMLVMSQEEYDKILEYKKKIPPFAKAWSGRLEDNINFLEAISKWFQVLLVSANNSQLITMKPVQDYVKDFVQEDKKIAEESANSDDDKGA